MLEKSLPNVPIKRINETSQSKISSQRIKQQLEYYLKQPELRKGNVPSRHEISNWFGDSENVLKDNNDYYRLLHRNSKDIFSLVDGHGYELHENGINNLNNILDEVEAHFISQKPSVMRYLKFYIDRLEKSSKNPRSIQELRKFFVPKTLEFLDSDGELDYKKQYHGFRLPQNSTKKDVLILMKFLFLQLSGQSKSDSQDILGRYLSYLKERLDLHSSMLFIRRKDVFHQGILSLGKGILKPKDIIINENFSGQSKKDHDYNSIGYDGNGIKLNIEGKDSVLIGRIKSSNSKWNKSQIKTGYKRVEDLKDFFGLTNLVENEDEICQNFAYFVKKLFELKKLGILKNIVISNKLHKEEKIIHEKILENLNKSEDIELIKFFEDIWEKRETIGEKKQYQDIKFEASMIFDGLIGNFEFKFMTNKMYQEAENGDDANHSLRLRVKKFGKIKGIVSKQFIKHQFNKRICRNGNFVLPHFNKKPMTSLCHNDLKEKDFLERVKNIFNLVLKSELEHIQIIYEKDGYMLETFEYISKDFLKNLPGNFVLVQDIPKKLQDGKVYIKKIDWINPL